MKNSLLTLLIVLVLAFTKFPSTAYAASKTAALEEFSFQESKGWVAVFGITGRWTEADLKSASITVNGKSLPLYCNFREEGRVAGTAPSLLPYIGQHAYLYLCGQGISATIPAKADPPLFPYQCAKGEGFMIDITVFDHGIPGHGFSGSSSGLYTVHQGFKSFKEFVIEDLGMEKARFKINFVTSIPVH
jgi:hypothetical protein